MIEVKGKGCIVARIVAHSSSSTSPQELLTYELEYPRFIHSELMTHRLFSRNAASSRAIPVKAMLEQVRNNPAMPIHWGANQPGMQAKEECDKNILLLVEGEEDITVTHHYTREQWWAGAADGAANMAEAFAEAGYHKQVVNRLLEPFQIMKTVVTATEFDNFFYLRCHADAQPEIKELAECMYQALQQSTPELLHPGEWHTPYVKHVRRHDGKLLYVEDAINPDGSPSFDAMPLEHALKISSSCCAQTSYRKSDDSLEKALLVYDRLVESKPVHASPFEHQGTPMKMEIGLGMEHKNKPANYLCAIGYQAGVTHSGVDGSRWSGNFKSWIQHRQLIDDNVCWEYSSEK